jgi:hypothetical protein
VQQGLGGSNPLFLKPPLPEDTRHLQTGDFYFMGAELENLVE